MNSVFETRHVYKVMYYKFLYGYDYEFLYSDFTTSAFPGVIAAFSATRKNFNYVLPYKLSRITSLRNHECNDNENIQD